MDAPGSERLIARAAAASSARAAIGRLTAIALATLGLGCSTTPPPSPDAALAPAGVQAPAWQPRPPTVLDPMPVSIALAAAAAPDGRLHVLYRQEAPRRWRHAVVDAADARPQVQDLPDSLFAPGPMPGAYPRVDLAFDHDGVAHALIDHHHLAWRQGRWARESGPPCEAFVRGGPPLRCVGPPSSSVPARRRLDIWVGPGIAVPVWGAVKKLAAYVLEPGGWQMQGVFDAASRLDIGLFQGVAAANGDIHAVYQRGRTLLGAPDVEWRYELLPGPDTSAPPPPTPEQRGRPAPADDPSWKLTCPPPPGFVDMRFWGGLGLAVDAVSGHGLVTLTSLPDAQVVCQRDVARDGLGAPRIAFSGTPYRRSLLSALGNDRFALLLEEQADAGWTRVTPGRSLFATMSDGRWSSALSLGGLAIDTRHGGQAPLVLLGQGRLVLVTRDADQRLVTIGFDPAP